MNVLFPCWSFAGATLKLHQSCSWKSHSKHPVAKSEKQNAIMGHIYIYIYTVYIIVYIHTIFINYHCKSSTCLPWKSDVWLIRIQQTKHDFTRGPGKTLVHNTSRRLVEGPSSKWTNNFPTVAGFGQPPNLNKRVPNVKGWQLLVCELVKHLNI